MEIDFSWTSDGSLACIHDWRGNYSRLFGHEIESSLSVAEFQEKARALEWTLLTLEELGVLMRAHPELVIVTDVKQDNLDALALIARVLPDSVRRVVPQIYHPSEYMRLQAMGYEKIIWTLYKYRDQEDLAKVLDEASRMDLLAVCMPVRLAKAEYAKGLRSIGIATYAHTVNSSEQWGELRDDWGVDQIYTDYLLSVGE